MAMQEAKEQFGTMLRWTAQPKDQKQADSTEFLGEVIQGWYLRKKIDVGQNDSNVYEIQLRDGRLVSVWGSGVLDGKFDSGYKNGPIPVGAEVRITYLGIAQPKTPGGRAYQQFKVECDVDSVKPANFAETVTAAAPAVGAAPQQTYQPAPAAPAPTGTPVAGGGF